MLIISKIFISEMYKKAGLDCDSIIEKVEDVLRSNVVIVKNVIKKLS